MDKKLLEEWSRLGERHGKFACPHCSAGNWVYVENEFKTNAHVVRCFSCEKNFYIGLDDWLESLLQGWNPSRSDEENAQAYADSDYALRVDGSKVAPYQKGEKT